MESFQDVRIHFDIEVLPLDLLCVPLMDLLLHKVSELILENGHADVTNPVSAHLMDLVPVRKVIKNVKMASSRNSVILARVRFS